LQGWLSPHRISPRQREALFSLLDSAEPSSAAAGARDLGLAEHFPVHAALIAILSHLEMAEDEAAGHWRAIALRREELTWRLGRDPGTRVAALDYLVNEKRLLSRPKIVDESAMEIAESAATADGLTGLPNEKTFRKALRSEIRRSSRRVQEFTLAVLDLEGFQRVNRNYGRAAGDAVLREVAILIQTRLRDMDLAGRLGGAHFALLLPLTRRSGAHVGVERIRVAVRDAFLRAGPAGPAIALTLSGGLAAYPDDGDTAQCLLECALRALSGARSQGGNQVVIHHREQRRCLRVRPMGAPVKWLARHRGSDGETWVQVRDISRSGALLEGPNVFAQGEELLLKMAVDSSRTNTPLEARVVRGEAVPARGTGNFRAGVRFFNPSPAAEASLEKLLERLRRQGVE
jgi:diguanylate cyclase (GGDEF)-like protein